MSMSTDQKGHFIVVGSTGSGKTAYAAAVVKTCLTRRERDEWHILRSNLSNDGRNGQNTRNRDE